ncbi:MAG TPA: hypothetical protein VG845_04435 [Dehalococcoidia bacterium]|jgi:hypothetical protein|nr:hypothetical protein [Dehalococcoidia bacterium]
MNILASTYSSTWKHNLNRFVVRFGGVALALSVAIGGLSALPGLGSREASVSPQSPPQALIGTVPDAALASSVVVQGQQDSLYLGEPLSPVVGETRDVYFGVEAHQLESSYLGEPLSPVVGETHDGYQ